MGRTWKYVRKHPIFSKQIGIIMALPLPKILYDVQPGGGINTVMNANNALALNMLKRQYYAPNIQSEINNRNALTEGQKIANQYMPEKLQAANAMAQLQNQFYAPNIQSEINSRNALIKKTETMTPLEAEELSLKNQYAPERLQQEAKKRQYELDNPQIANKSFAPTNELKNAQFYQDAKAGFIPNTGRTQPIENEEQRQYYMNAFSPKKTHEAIEKHQEKLLARKHWDSLPAETKSHLVAIGQGAGIRGDEIEKELSTGKTFDEILYERGFDPKNPPEPVYELTKGNQKALNEREYASREVKYLSNFINKATGDYAGKVRGYNFNQVKDALLGKNEKQQAEFLAARMLSQELVNLRLVLGGAKGTVHAIKSMTEKSMFDSKIFEPLVSNEVWHKTQEIADRELQKAFISSKKGYGQPTKIEKEGSTTKKYNPNDYDIPKGYITVYKKGIPYYFPPDLVKKKLTKGYTYE